MRRYIEEAGINVYHDDQKLLEEVVNGSRGGEYWKENEYSNDPDYGEVDPEIWNHWDITEKLLEGETQK